jgi:Nitrile hydratase beta subunit
MSTPAVPPDQGRFRAGDVVRVREEVPEGNPRTPTYLRNWTGTVVRSHGVVPNPLDHHDPYPPLYSIVFVLGDSPGSEEVLADIHEEWLVRVDDSPVDQA